MKPHSIALRMGTSSSLPVCVALAVVALLGAVPVTAEGTLYFADIFKPTYSDGYIRSVYTDGSELQMLVDTGGGLRGVAVDPAAGKLYWTNVDTDKIRRANLDGSNPEDLVTEGLAFPMAIALHPPINKLYWGEQSLAQIGSANLDGSNAAPLISTPFHSGLEVDAVNGKLYWSTSITAEEGEILRANLDGSNVEIVVTEIDKPADIALDIAGGKIYWTDYVVDVVRRANLDGSNVETLYVVGANLNPDGIVLDLSDGKVYWGQAVTTNRDKIIRMNLDGSDPEDVIDGFGIVTKIDIILQIPGDLNGDGCVDQRDLGILLADWGCQGGNCPGDVDGDGDTDQSDLGIMLAHWGEGCP